MSQDSYTVQRADYRARLAAHSAAYNHVHTTATYEQLTRYLVDAPLPDAPPANPVYVKTMAIFQKLIDFLAHHTAMVDILQECCSARPVVSSKVYHMWLYWEQSLVILSQCDYEINDMKRWWDQVVERVIMGIAMMKFQAQALDELHHSKDPASYTIVEFGTEVMDLVDELIELDPEIRAGRELWPYRSTHNVDLSALSIRSDV